jgi:hypothetical protein
MAIPVATAGADQAWASSTLPKTVSLTGSGTNTPDQYRWTMLAVPPGSSANSGTNGSFTAGVYTGAVATASFVCDVIGGYVLQLEAHNSTGWSDPNLDKEGAQTIIYIQTARLGLKLPGYRQYRYDADLNADLTALETGVPAAHASRHQPGGADAMAVDQAAGTASLRSLGTGATQACAGADSRLSDSRAPSGSASGDLGGTYPSPTVSQARGLRETAGPTTLAMGSVADGQYLKRVGSTVVGAAGGGGGASPLTTKGDLYGFSTVDARLPVGADGKTLVADSSETLGLKWASQAAAGLASDGMSQSSAKMGTNQIIVATTMSPLPTPFTLPFTTVAGEKVIVSFSALGIYISAASTCYLQLYVDGVAVGSVSQFNVNGTVGSAAISDTYAITVATAGSHTLELRANKYTGTGDWTLHSYSGDVSVNNPTQLRIMQFRGGYIQPENVPILKYNSASTIDVGAAPGADSQLRVMLTDGSRYLSNAALTVNLTVSGRGGLDTSTEQPSTWYYVYAVPATTAGQLAVVASVTAPGSGGPTGFSAWKYLGAIRNDGSSNIKKFNQSGSTFTYREGVIPADSAALGTTQKGSDTTAVNLSLSDAVPPLAFAAYLQHRVQISSGFMIQALFPDGEPVDTTAGAKAFSQAICTNATQDQWSSCLIPMTTNARIQYKCYTSGGTIAAQGVYVQGWTDGYLTQTVTQSQPMQTLTGSNGTQTTQAALSSNFSVSSTSFADVTGLSITLTTLAGEAVMVTLNGFIYNSGSANACYINLLVDGTIYGDATNGLLETGGPTGVVGPICFSRMITGLTAGSHTFKIQAKRDTANCTIYANAVLQVTQFLGGYSNPDNTPILAYSSASAVAIQAAPGASGTLQVTLSDGQKYTAASPLSVSLAASGRGGLDTGSEASNQWYYVFAVPPATVGGSFACVASASPPSTGPTGFTGWKYLGAIRNDGSSNILKFFQDGQRFDYALLWQVFSGTGGPDTPPGASMDLSAVVPLSASHAVLNLVGRSATNNWVELYIDGETVNSHVAVFDMASIESIFPTPTTPKKCWLNRGASGSVSLYATGWLDGWLGQGAPQVQAKAVADTKLPRLTWVGASSVTAAAAPGQPGTVRVTLQDGTQRSFTGTLTFDPSTGAVDGGLDTGTETSSTWFYLYLVPKSTDNTLLVIRGSITGPANGPTGYANWSYLGAVRNDGSSNLIRFRQTGTQFKWSDWVVYDNNSNFGPDAGWISKDISSAVPASASEAEVMIHQTVAAGENWSGTISGDGLGTALYLIGDTGSGGKASNSLSGSVAMATSQTIYRKINRWAGGSLTMAFWILSVRGWTDSYLS